MDYNQCLSDKTNQWQKKFIYTYLGESAAKSPGFFWYVLPLDIKQLKNRKTNKN